MLSRSIRHLQLQGQGHRSQVAKEIERLLAGPNAICHPLWTAEHERRPVDVEPLNWKGAT
jgi:hypothetical protein